MDILNSEWFKESFVCSGEWFLDNDRLRYSVSEDESFNETQFFDEKAKIYMFISSDGEVIYVGKTANTVRQRFVGYRTPGNTQQTNRRVNEGLVELLSKGKKINIYVSDFPSQLKWENFSISLSAGLEDALIESIQPRLNRLGVDGAAMPELALMEVDGNEGNAEKDGVLDVLEDDAVLDTVNFLVSLAANHTYVNGYINLRKKTSEQVGDHGEQIDIDLYRGDRLDESIVSRINRTANRNGSVRIVGNNGQLAKWFQGFPRDSRLLGEVLNRHRLKIQYIEPKDLVESTFEILLIAQHTYINGFINLRLKTSEQLGGHGENIEIELYRGNRLDERVISRVNRTANRNGSVRVVGNNGQLAKWFQKFPRGTLLRGTVLSRNKIKLVHEDG